MIVHLVDGTYELFRHFYGLRRVPKNDERPLGAAIGVLHTVLEMIENAREWGNRGRPDLVVTVSYEVTDDAVTDRGLGGRFAARHGANRDRRTRAQTQHRDHERAHPPGSSDRAAGRAMRRAHSQRQW